MTCLSNASISRTARGGMALLGDTPLLPLLFRGLISSRLGLLNENVISTTEAHLQALFGKLERRV